MIEIRLNNRPAKVVHMNVAGVFVESRDGVADAFMTYETFKRTYGFDPKSQERDSCRIEAIQAEVCPF